MENKRVSSELTINHTIEEPVWKFLGRNVSDETLTPFERALWKEYFKLCIIRPKTAIKEFRLYLVTLGLLKEEDTRNDG